jgi:hypothetical protein
MIAVKAGALPVKGKETREHDPDLVSSRNVDTNFPLKHDPEKWIPVCGKRSCPIRNKKRDGNST